MSNEQKAKQELFDLIENQGWKIYDNSDQGYIDLENYSPAGEDLYVTIQGESLCEIAQDLQQYAQNFNAEEHAAGWYGRNNGEPSSLRTLLADADEIQEMLDDLSIAIGPWLDAYKEEV